MGKQYLNNFLSRDFVLRCSENVGKNLPGVTDSCWELFFLHGCFSCFDTMYLSPTLKANVSAVSWHFLRDKSLGSPAMERELFRRFSFCLQRWQASSFVCLLTYLLPCLVCSALFIANQLIFKEVRVCLCRLTCFSETWKVRWSWWKDFMKQRRR